MRRATIATALGLTLTTALGLAAMARAPAASLASVPAQVDDFRLTTATGHSETLYRYHDAPAVVLVSHGETLEPMGSTRGADPAGRA